MSTTGTPQRTQWASALADTVLIVLFLCALVLPGIDRLIGLDPGPPLVEKRAPAPAPDVPHTWENLRSWPARFESYWNDTFGFRRTLVRTYDLALIAIGTSPFPDRVTIGRDKWLFYAAERSLEDYKGELPFTTRDMIRWQYLLTARRDWLRDRGIPYILFIAPNKETIYPEYMPSRIRRGSRHRLDELLSFLAAHSDLEIIDPRSLLLSEKEQGDLYLRTDTHWSNRGALLVERMIAERLAQAFPAVQPLSPAALKVTLGSGSGDLAGMLGFAGWLSEVWEQVTVVHPRAQEVGVPTNVASWTEVNDRSLPRAVFFYDSFGKIQIPYFAEHFSHLRSEWVREMNPEIVEAEGAQVVVQEMCERFLLTLLPRDSMLLSDNSHVRAAFEASSTVLARFPGATDVMTPVTGLTVQASENGALHLDASDATRSSAMLPTMDRPAGTVPVIHVDVESPAEGRLELAYLTRLEPTYDDLRKASWPLHPGANVAWFVLSDPELTGPLRLDLTTPGSYRLTALEARAVSSDLLDRSISAPAIQHAGGIAYQPMSW